MPLSARRSVDILVFGSTGVRAVYMTVRLYQTIVADTNILISASDVESVIRGRSLNLLITAVNSREAQQAEGRIGPVESLDVIKQWVVFASKPLSRNLIQSLHKVWFRDHGLAICDADHQSKFVFFTPLFC